MVKILILAMSCNRKFFEDEEQMIRQFSYAKHVLAGKYPDVDFWTYTASGDGKVHVSVKNRKIGVPCPDDIDHTFIKTKLTLQALDAAGVQYDYIFRTNLSTWVNVPYLVRFVNSIPEVDSGKIFSSSVNAVWNGSGPDAYSYYGVGNSLLIPRRWVDVIKVSDPEDLRQYDRTSGVTDSEKPNSIYGVDDNAIGFICNVWAENHGMDPRSVWKSFNGCYSVSPATVRAHGHLDYIAVPFRSYDGRRDMEFFYGKMMQDVADEWETVFDETPETLYANSTNRQFVVVARFGKTEPENEIVWLERDSADILVPHMDKFGNRPEILLQFLKKNGASMSKI